MPPMRQRKASGSVTYSPVRVTRSRARQKQDDVSPARSTCSSITDPSAEKKKKSSSQKPEKTKILVATQEYSTQSAMKTPPKTKDSMASIELCGASPAKNTRSRGRAVTLMKELLNSPRRSQRKTAQAESDSVGSNSNVEAVAKSPPRKKTDLAGSPSKVSGVVRLDSNSEDEVKLLHLPSTAEKAVTPQHKTPKIYSPDTPQGRKDSPYPLSEKELWGSIDSILRSQSKSSMSPLVVLTVNKSYEGKAKKMKNVSKNEESSDSDIEILETKPPGSNKTAEEKKDIKSSTCEGSVNVQNEEDDTSIAENQIESPPGACSTKVADILGDLSSPETSTPVSPLSGLKKYTSKSKHRKMSERESLNESKSEQNDINASKGGIDIEEEVRRAIEEDERIEMPASTSRSAEKRKGSLQALHGVVAMGGLQANHVDSDSSDEDVDEKQSSTPRFAEKDKGSLKAVRNADTVDNFKGNSVDSESSDEDLDEAIAKNIIEKKCSALHSAEEREGSLQSTRSADAMNELEENSGEIESSDEDLNMAIAKHKLERRNKKQSAVQIEELHAHSASGESDEPEIQDSDPEQQLPASAYSPVQFNDVSRKLMRDVGFLMYMDHEVSSCDNESSEDEKNESLATAQKKANRANRKMEKKLFKKSKKEKGQDEEIVGTKEKDENNGYVSPVDMSDKNGVVVPIPSKNADTDESLMEPKPTLQEKQETKKVQEISLSPQSTEKSKKREKNIWSVKDVNLEQDRSLEPKKKKRKESQWTVITLEEKPKKTKKKAKHCRNEDLTSQLEYDETQKDTAVSSSNEPRKKRKERTDNEDKPEKKKKKSSVDQTYKQFPEKSNSVVKSANTAEDSDEGPSIVSFSDSRSAAMADMQAAAEGIRLASDRKKLKQKRKHELFSQQKTTKLQNTVAEKVAEIRKKNPTANIEVRGGTILVSCDKKKLDLYNKDHPDFNILKMRADKPYEPVMGPDGKMTTPFEYAVAYNRKNLFKHYSSKKGYKYYAQKYADKNTKEADYIPLQATTSSTKFGVAPLNNLESTSSKTGEAVRNFRQEMLFGSRVRREPVSVGLSYHEKLKVARKDKSENK